MNTVEVGVRPRSPFKLPGLTGGDRLIRRAGGGFERLLIVESSPVLCRIRAAGAGEYRFHASALDPSTVAGPGAEKLTEADEDTLLEAVGRMRFALAIDLDLVPLRDLYGDDPLLAPALNAMVPGRPQRRPDPWEALLWAISEQLIEYRRAAEIQRRMIRRWGLRLPTGRITARGWEEHLATVPSPQAIAAAAPAELEGCGLSPRRAIATIKVAREVASGRCRLEEEGDDRRLLAIPEIGPWTVACLALRGRGDPDALLAGDLGQVKLVGYLNGLGRNAEIEEVEAFYERYSPWRGLVGEYLLSAHGGTLHGPGNTARIRRGRPGRTFPRAA